MKKEISPRQTIGITPPETSFNRVFINTRDPYLETQTSVTYFLIVN